MELNFWKQQAPVFFFSFKKKQPQKARARSHLGSEPDLGGAVISGCHCRRRRRR
jgi:hypothetical protein